ncbi:SIR2 family protein [Nocardioides renjunii]|uniref:hypothetical protein n=1 Tax=Nocardioides renjunii TaxID=3095075 RepID=UPI002AFFB0A3|nr:hypothetical protein [Nocardioides sp. S-34]WQQ22410.1 hypothetical protein SHK17_00155 [Nocardioides sp. S-34]
MTEQDADCPSAEASQPPALLRLSEAPPELLGCVSDNSGGRLVIVTGAGSSMDWPTGLRSGAEYSEMAFSALVQDQLLASDSCDQPRDLSLVADAVFDAYGSQKNLTDRLPRSDWRNASPNEGHRIAAALLIDGLVRAIVTLNYDMAFQAALSELGAPSQVTIAKGPEDHAKLSGRSLIYLHRSAESDPETWVLRKADLDEGWRGGWEAMIAAGVLYAPVTLFAGLGSPAAVLTETVGNLAGLGSKYYLADPYGGGAFEQALSGQLTAALQLGWVELMRALSVRAATAQAKQLELDCRDRAKALGLEHDHVEKVCEILGEIGIVYLGRLRSAWLLHSKQFSPRQDGPQSAHLADLALALNAAMLTLEADLEITEDGGLCELVIRDSGRTVSAQCVHGMGLHTWSAMLARLEMRTTRRLGSGRARVVIAAGVVEESRALPDDLVEGSPTSDDLVRGPEAVVLWKASELTSKTLNRDALLGRLVS